MAKSIKISDELFWKQRPILYEDYSAGYWSVHVCDETTQSWRKNILKGREATAVGLHTVPEIKSIFKIEKL